METSNLLHKEIKVTDIKVLSELREKKGWTQWEYQQKDRIKEKKSQTEKYSNWNFRIS